MERLLQPQTEGIDGPKEALQRGLADRADQLIDFGDGQDRGQLELLGHTELGERGPVPGAGVAVEELQSGVGDFERVRLPLLIVLDVKQVPSEIVFASLVRGFFEPLGELPDSAEVGFPGSLFAASQLQVLLHLPGEGRQGDAFSLGGGRRGANGSVRIRGTTCHGPVLLNQHPRT